LRRRGRRSGYLRLPSARIELELLPRIDDVISSDSVPASDVSIVEAMTPRDRVERVAALDRVRHRALRRTRAARDEQRQRKRQEEAAQEIGRGAVIQLDRFSSHAIAKYVARNL